VCRCCWLLGVVAGYATTSAVAAPVARRARASPSLLLASGQRQAEARGRVGAQGGGWRVGAGSGRTVAGAAAGHRASGIMHRARYALRTTRYMRVGVLEVGIMNKSLLSPSSHTSLFCLILSPAPGKQRTTGWADNARTRHGRKNENDTTAVHSPSQQSRPHPTVHQSTAEQCMICMYNDACMHYIIHRSNSNMQHQHQPTEHHRPPGGATYLPVAACCPWVPVAGAGTVRTRVRISIR
jgi:hypothetical protein